MLPSGRITTGLAIATAVAFALLWLGGWVPLAAAVAGFVPARASGAFELVGSLPWWLTPLSATLVHADWLHLGFNMLMLVVTGRFAEQAIGGAGLLVLYAIGAYAAALGQYLWEPTSDVAMIGASGAISAVVAVYALLYGQRRASAIGPIPARWVHVAWLAAGWICVQILIALALSGQTMSIAIFAHIGGFLAGLALARPLLLWRYRRA